MPCIGRKSILKINTARGSEKLKGFFVKNGVIPSSCFKCELGMADEQIPDCPFYKLYTSIEQGEYKQKRHPDCPLKEMEIKAGEQE